MPVQKKKKNSGNLLNAPRKLCKVEYHPNIFDFYALDNTFPVFNLNSNNL